MSEKRKICIVTGTRAEWGLLSTIASEIKKRGNASLQIVATNTHLSPLYGMTVNEIIDAGFAIDAKVKITDDNAGSSPIETAHIAGRCLIGISDAFATLKPDIVVILGDRYEMLAVATAATLARIPIAHLHGGETTEGAIDNAIRNAITSLASLHLTSTERYRQKIISMGENPKAVINTGAIGVHNALNLKLMNRAELQRSLSFFIPKGTLLVTYHPATLDSLPVTEQCQRLLSALNAFPDNRILITYPNNDAGSDEIIRQILEFEKANPEHVRVIPSLGQLRYFSILQFVSAVIGNSSSGIIEVPSFGIPTVNIGPRQRGRVYADSVINTDCTTIGIKDAIETALSVGHRNDIINPYGKPDTLSLIVDTLLNTPLSSFYKCEIR